MNIDQRGANAGNDLVAGNKNETHIHVAPAVGGVVEKLLCKLQAEMDRDEKVRDTIEALARFHTRRSRDGIDGLEAKLTMAGRDAEYFDAIEKKELFSKLLDRWSLYASAQEILAYLLAKVETEFMYIVHPQIKDLSIPECNLLVMRQILDPIVNECAASVFEINHAVAFGMLYWLAEQCFVRWHL